MPAERSVPVLDRLSHELGLPPSTVEVALAEAGVDAGYLQDALLDGDPQGAIASAARRLNVPRRDFVVALAKIRGHDLVAATGGEDAAETARRVARLVESAVDQVAPPEGGPVRVQLATREARERLASTRAAVLGPEFGRADERARRIVVKAPADTRRAQDALARALQVEGEKRRERLALLATITGALLVGLGLVALVSMDLFRLAASYLLAGGLVAGGSLLVVAAWRLQAGTKRP